MKLVPKAFEGRNGYGITFRHSLLGKVVNRGLNTTDETKAILRAFLNVFPNASLWATSDLEWVMIGINPPLPKPDQELARRLWTDPTSAADLVRAGLEIPEQMSASFVMDAEEIDRITRGMREQRILENMNCVHRTGFARVLIERSDQDGIVKLFNERGGLAMLGEPLAEWNVR